MEKGEQNMEEKECVLASLDEDRKGAKKISPCIKESHYHGDVLGVDAR